MFNINASDTFAFLDGNYDHSSFGLAIIPNENSGVLQVSGGKAKNGSIICYTRNNSTYEKVCLALGGKDTFTHSSGKAYIL